MLAAQELNRLAIALGGNGGLQAFVNAVAGVGPNPPSGEFSNITIDTAGNVRFDSNISLTVANLAVITTAGSGVGNIGLTLQLDSTGLLGFFGNDPISRPAAYTQTYSTASRTHDNPTAVSMTDTSGGSISTSIGPLPPLAAAVTDTTAASLSSVQAIVTALQNQISSAVAMISKLAVDQLNIKKVLNSVIDDHQAYGLLR